MGNQSSSSEGVARRSSFRRGETSPASLEERQTLQFFDVIPRETIRVLNFAAMKHRDQRCFDRERSPFVNHLLNVVRILVFEGNIHDPTVLCGALLAQTIEETETTYSEIQKEFGRDIMKLVQEVTIDQTLPQDKRVSFDLIKMERVSLEARLIRLAHILSNLRTTTRSPPHGWSLQRFRDYFGYMKSVVDRIRGTSVTLESAIDSVLGGTFLLNGRPYPVLVEKDELNLRTKAAGKGTVVAFGVPMVDFVIQMTPDQFEKYGIRPGYEYMTSPEMPFSELFNDLDTFKDVLVSTGGAAFDTMRACQWMLRVPGACSIAGAVGTDQYGESVERFAANSGIDLIRWQKDHYKTAMRVSVALPNDDKKAKVLRPGSAFRMDVDPSKILNAVKHSKVAFITAMFTHASPKEALLIAKQTLADGTHLAMNAEGAILCTEETKDVLEELLAYVYCLFGSEKSLKLMSQTLDWDCDSLEKILIQFGRKARLTANKQRLGFAISDNGDAVVCMDDEILREKITDRIRNANRDWIVAAASGAFISQLALGKDVKECLDSARYAANVCMGRVDMNLPSKPAPEHLSTSLSAMTIEPGAAALTSSISRKLTLDILKRLPKAELHCHLDGSVRISTIIELAKEQKVELPTFDPEELTKMVCVGKDCPSLVEYLRGFGITLKVMQKKYAITRCMYEVCEDAVADGVRYLEVRFSPILHVAEGLSLSGVMDAVCEGVVMAESNLDITARIIVCGMRHLESSVTEKLAEIAWRYKNRGVVAFDLAGPEDGFSSLLHKSAFDIVRSHMLNCTLHSGEAAGWESVQDSIRGCGAKRIGHGVRTRENPKLLEYVVNHRIPIESCVTSNLQTKAVSSLAEHPFREYFDLGVLIVPCTDNVTVSDVTLSGEYLLIQDAFNMTPKEMLRLIDNGFRSAFLDVHHRKRLRAEIRHTCLSVLREEGFDVADLVSNPKLLAPEDHEFSDGSAEYELYSYENMRARASVYFFSSFKKGVEWGHANPSLTLAMMRSLPKSDLHCRLDGSASLQWFYGEYTKCRKEGSPIVKTIPDFPTFDAFRCAVQEHEHDEKSDSVAKQIMNSLCQTKSQISGAIEDVVKNAKEDGVMYMELHVRPLAHLRAGLTPEDVIETVCSQVRKVNENDSRITLGIVLFVEPTTPETSLDDVMSIAKLVVKYQDCGVCGFGMFGRDGYWTETSKFDSLFDYLKMHSVNVSMSAGRDTADTVVPALYRGGASRIAGGYGVHKDPDVVTHLANYAIPMEMSLTNKMERGTSDVRTFAGNAIRLYLDHDLKVSICSFDMSLYPHTRSEMLLKVTEECNLEIHELLQVLRTSINRSFQPRAIRKRLFEQFWMTAVSQLEKAGFQHFRERHYFPSSETRPPVQTLEEEIAHALRYLE
eukprot:TRINITY_DN82176_c0_g1_i1.p1 TRINITY_DN82176_c0_g1~~TRINITY_DN82176_c0_g1_i1.p1  ORF type:complete len:1394 (+),score=360.81 TRINITY_DN82176_c0_g1_i1:132-4313(+)